MSITLGCDCRYSSRVSLMFGRVKESGEYRIENDRIVLSRSSSETSWPYEIVAQKLRLTEAANETHDYTRAKVIGCR